MNTEEQEKLLDEAFRKCDIEKLSQAIAAEINLNKTDEWDVPLWDGIKYIFDFQEDSIARDEV